MAHMRKVAVMSSPHEEVAAEVRATLARNKIRQSAVAEALSLSRASVSRRLKGEQPFTVPELLVVADLAGVNASEFFRAA